MSAQEVSPVWIGAEPKFGTDWLHPCALHLGELEIDTNEENGYPPGCPECGCLIETDGCSWCGTEWIAFGGQSPDDIIRPAGITSAGDFMCANCAVDTEEVEAQEYSEDWEDDYP